MASRISRSITTQGTFMVKDSMKQIERTKHGQSIASTFELKELYRV